jgi:OFA family oxalate/formate antiporter-like MFS transporter
MQSTRDVPLQPVPQSGTVGGAKRWGIAAAGFVLQIALGAVYAWSVFRIPLSREFGWSVPQVTLTFTICISVDSVACFVGGLLLNRMGPRVVAVTGGFLYGLGVFLASFSARGLAWLYLTYGVMGGAGLGMAFIVPVAVLVKWFPDRRGLITGVAVAGFGAGALATASVAVGLIQSFGVLRTFAYLGITYAVIAMCAGWFMENPPDGWRPAGWTPTAAQVLERSVKDFSLGEALATWQWWALWGLLFLNASAGIALISQEAPLFEKLAAISATAAGAMVGVVSIGNSAGRIFWAWASDGIGRRWTFATMFLLQCVLFWILPSLATAAIIAGVSFVILSCYGGGFGTLPAFAADYFGSRNVGSIYGLMATAWGAASAFGPLLLAATLRTTSGYASGLHIIAAIMAVSTLLPIAVRPPRPKPA